jgi:Na+/H+ antiporter
MHTLFGTLAFSAIISVALGALLRQRGWGIAIPLIVAGALIGQAPFGPSAPPDPQLVLVAVLAPLVFGEALSSSFFDLRKVSRPVLALAIGLVLATTLAVGAITSLLVAVPFAMAAALGAVLAPTDAVAVTTVARRAGLPRRLVSILEGESLVNDGTGLTVLRIALVAAAAGTVTLVEIGTVLMLSVAVGVGVGVLGGLVIAWALVHGRDIIAINALILVVPFGLYLLAEELEGSGILAVVVAALIIAARQHADPGHTGRVQSVNLWKHITFALQCLAFFLVGLELPDVVLRVSEQDFSTLLVLVPMVLLTLIAVRFMFVFVMVGWARRRGRENAFVMRGAVILSWAGARGPISGLAAFSIPVTFASGDLVPERDLILATTFIVIVVTLLLSMTIAPLARALRVKADDDTALLRHVDVRLARAALDRLADIEIEALDEGRPLDPVLVEQLRAPLEHRIDAASEAMPSGPTEDGREQSIAAARAMVRAEQEELLAMRDLEGLPDAVVRPILRDLDVRDHALRTQEG